eukprot:3875756-Prymnesium_polylepis.2
MRIGAPSGLAEKKGDCHKQCRPGAGRNGTRVACAVRASPAVSLTCSLLDVHPDLSPPPARARARARAPCPTRCVTVSASHRQAQTSLEPLPASQRAADRHCH